MTKKTFIQFAYSHGFDCEYDGHKRIMYVHPLNGEAYNNISIVTKGLLVKFKIVFNNI